MSRIKEVRGVEIIDSRGNPTVAALVTLESGATGYAAAPSGASTGTHEAVELRDKDPKRYGGKGVSNAVANVNGELRSALIGKSARDQETIARTMLQADGTHNKGRLGANAILSVSLAVARAAAADGGVPLYRHLSKNGHATMQMPVPMMNIVNGGAHADNNIDVQEFMILPIGAPTFREALRCGVEVFQSLKSILKAKGMNTAVGDEGGFAPDLPSNAVALDTILEATDKAGYVAGKDVALGVDVASSEFYRDGRYTLASENRSFTSAEFVDYLAGWVERYPIVTIEDGMAEDDWNGWALLTKRLGDRVQLVGDGDLQARHRPGRRQCDPDQAEPDRDADRDAGRDRDGR